MTHKARLAALERRQGQGPIKWAFQNAVTGLWRVTPDETNLTTAELDALPGTVFAFTTRVVPVGGEDANTQSAA